MKYLSIWAASVLIAGCVPTADFTALREDVRDVQAENRKLRSLHE